VSLGFFKFLDGPMLSLWNVAGEPLAMLAQQGKEDPVLVLYDEAGKRLWSAPQQIIPCLQALLLDWLGGGIGAAVVPAPGLPPPP